MPVRPVDAQINDQGPLERVAIKSKDLIDKDAAQYQRVGACPDRKSRATFSGHALCHGNDALHRVTFVAVWESSTSQILGRLV